MDERELHLLLNHFPVILTVMALAASLLAIVKKSRAAWMYAAASLTVAGLFSYPTFFTGHGAHELIEDFWWVKADSWHEHQMAAGFANLWTLVGGAFAVYAWWKLTRAKDAMLANWMQRVFFLLCVMSASTMARAAWLGGRVIREQESMKTPPAGGAAPPKMARDSH